MKNLILLLSFFLSLVPAKSHALESCFIYKESEKFTSVGECLKRHPPQSTFKLVLALIGFDEGILLDDSHPVLPFEKKQPSSVSACNSPQTPASWIKNSCVWYSQEVTKKLGMKKFKEYMSVLNYGNQDVSGTKRKPDGLMDSWISSSLKISAKEQVEFLENMLNGKLNVKPRAVENTKKILYHETFANDWKLYGKTGTGDLINADGSHDKSKERGWFVGWIEKGSQRIYFAQYKEVENVKAKNSFNYIASKKAKEEAILKLKKMTSIKS